MDLRIAPRLEGDREIDPLRADEIQRLRSVAGLERDRAGGKALLELPQDRRQQVLTDGEGGGEPETAGAPLAQPLQLFARQLHLGKDPLGALQQLLATLGQCGLFASAVEEPAADVLLERADGMADG